MKLFSLPVSATVITTATTTAAALLPAAATAFIVDASTTPTKSFFAITAFARRHLMMQQQKLHFHPSSSSSTTSLLSAAERINNIQEDLTFTPPLDSIRNERISDRACIDAATKMRRVMVPVSKEVSDAGYVGISFIHWRAEENNNSNAPSLQKNDKHNFLLPLLLVHGFDSSSLEYRRLGPRLASMGIDVYCVDLLGWGFTQLGDDSIRSYSAEAKIEALAGFWKVVGNDDEVVVGGASLGGAAAIEFAAKNIARSTSSIGSSSTDENDDVGGEGFVRGAVLIDAQGFVDGIGPMSFLPAPLARAGIKVLQSIPLRQSANRMSYYDVDTFATEDAQKIGRLHCLRQGWEDGMLSFMQSGGFRPKEQVSKIDVPSLILWGRQDGILDGNEFANKFIDCMPNAQLRWIEECGHVPHLERPETTAQYIAEFLRSEEMQPSKKNRLTTAPSFAFAGNKILDGLFGFLN